MQAPFSDFWWTIGISTVALLLVAAAFVATLVVSQRRFIAHQRRQMEALRQSEEKYRNLFENSLVGMVKLSLDDLSILDGNRTSYQLFGAKDLAGIRDVFRRLPDEHYRALCDAIASGSVVEHVEVRFLRPDGTPLWVSMTCRANRIEHTAEAVLVDITEEKDANERLIESHRQLRILSARLESVREEERVRLARQVHDELGQILTAVKVHLTVLLETAEGKLKRSAPLMTKKLSSLIKVVDDAIDLVKNISYDLRPLVLEDLGLKEAIEWEASQFEQRTGIRCRVVSTKADIKMDREQATAVFRIVQEALTNVSRHAAAQTVSIVLRNGASDLNLEVVDDGKGISNDEASHARALGILGMKERAALLGGTLSVGRARGAGTRVHLNIPLQSPSVRIGP